VLPTVATAQYVKPKTEKEAKQRKNAVTSNSGHYTAGMKDQQEGRQRKLPSYFTDANSKNAKDWLAGWDAAAQSAPAAEATPDLKGTQLRYIGKSDWWIGGRTLIKPGEVVTVIGTYEQFLNLSNGAQVERAAIGKQFAVENVSPPPQPATPDPFANNKLFTADKVAAARERMKKKLGTLNSGMDPELLVDGMTIAGAYIESGVRKYSDYARAMVDDFGDKIRPYLRSFYEAARNYPGLDTEGMTPAAEIEAMERAGTAEHQKPAPGTEEAVGEKVPAPKRIKERKPADVRLQDDFGVTHIDGFAGEQNTEREDGSGSVKTAFLKDTSAYLKDVAKRLQEAGFVPHNDRKGKPMKAVSVNESGVATSGDVMLALFNPGLDRGIYINIGGTSIRGAVPTTRSGVAVMMRVTKAGDPYGGSQNRWMPVNLSSEELVAEVLKAVQQEAPKPAPAPTLQGVKVTFDVLVEDTGQTASVTVEATNHLQELEDRQAAMQALFDCLKR
jgi:hypothetical protein